MKSKKLNKAFFSLLVVSLLLCVFGFFYSSNVGFARENVKVTYVMPLSDCSIENYNSSYTVLDPDGDNVTVTNGSFVAKKIGDYTISNQGVIIEKITVLGAVPTSDFNFSQIPAEIHAGENLLIPKVTISSKYQTVNSYNVDVIKGDVLIATFDNVTDSFKYTFSDSGLFTIRFWFKDVFNYVEECKVNLAVIEEPIIIFDKELATACPTFIEYDIGEIYGFYKDYYVATVKVYSPSGDEVTLVNNCFTPDVEGEYTISASFKYGDRTISAEKKIETYHSTASFFNKSKNLTYLKENVSVPVGALKDGSGIELTLDGGGSYVYYNEIIDLKSLSKNDSIISFYVDSNKSNINKIKVTLIDVNDESNRFSVFWNQNLWNHSYSYMLVNYDKYSLGISNEEYNFGLPRETFGAVLGNTSFVKNEYNLPFNFSYDCDEKAVYTNPSTNPSSLLKVLDLDDSSALGERKIFNGFSSDKVYLKIELEELKTADLVITHIAGKSVNEEVNILNENYLRYSFDGDYISKGDVLYDGGINYTYQLPTPVCNEILNDEIDYSVKLSYLGQDVTTLVNDNLQFTPTSTGTYTITYTAKDYKGNDLEHNFDIDVNENSPEIRFLTTDVERNLNEYVTPPEITFDGGTGKIHVEKTYFYNDKVIELDENGKVLLYEKGKVEIKVKLTDFLGVTLEKSVFINISENVREIILDEKPTSFFVGVETTLPDFVAIDYNFDETESGYLMSKTITVNGVEIPSNRKYTFPSAGEYTIKYIAGKGTVNEFFETFIVNVLPVGKLNNLAVDEYVITDSHVTKIHYESGLAFRSSSDFTIKMPYAIPINTFTVELSAISDYANFSHINFYIKDYYNENKAITITLYPMADGNFKICVNDGNQQYLSSKQAGLSSAILGGYGISGKKVNNTTFKFYENEKIITSVKDVRVCNVKEFLSGDVFVGFEKSLIELSIEVCGVTSDSLFVLNSLASVNLTTIAFDDGDAKGPVIALIGENKQITLNDDIALLPAVSYDLLQGKCEFTSSYIITPSGQRILFDANVGGTLKATEFGNYKLVYISEDRFGNESKLEKTVACNDKVLPEIVLPEIANEYKLNSTLSKIDFTATDNYILSNKYVLIKKPTGEVTVLNSSITLQTKGVYTLMFYAEDTQGNFIIVEKMFEVK